MAGIWFTSDTHFGHESIIEHARRPFSSVEEMDAELVRRWNERVRPGDVVWHLGDFAWRGRSAGHYRIQLNGDVRFLRGNHDPEDWGVGYGPYHEIPGRGDRPAIVLCHYPIEDWNWRRHGSVHLHGHTHGHGLMSGLRRLCVCTEATGYAPINMIEVLAVVGGTKI